nr:hypothetical protein [Wolbachia endosymbiont of Litomosoides brasiliensis]
MRIRIQEKFGLNVNKSIMRRNMQKMKFSHITLKLIHNEQDKGG